MMHKHIIILSLILWLCSMVSSYAGDSIELGIKTHLPRKTTPENQSSLDKANDTFSIETAFNLVNNNILKFSYPSSWSVVVSSDTQYLSTTLEIKPVAGKAFFMLMTPYGATDSRGPFTIEEMQDRATTKANALVDSSAEKRYSLSKLEGKQFKGYYFQMTDIAPKPDGWALVTQGFAATPTALMAFKIFTPSKESREVYQGLALIKNMTIE